MDTRKYHLLDTRIVLSLVLWTHDNTLYPTGDNTQYLYDNIYLLQ